MKFGENRLRSLIFSNMFFFIFTFSSHTEYVKKESIVIAWVKKNSFFLMNVHVLYVLEQKTKEMSICVSVCLSGCLAVRTWILAVDTITFQGVSGSKQNFVGDFYVWNVGLVLKSRVKSWSWSWSSSWIWFLSLYQILKFRCIHQASSVRNQNQATYFLKERTLLNQWGSNMEIPIHMFFSS